MGAVRSNFIASRWLYRLTGVTAATSDFKRHVKHMILYLLYIYNNNTWQWKEKSHFLPLLSALYGEFLKGRGKLKLRRSFSSALKSLPNRCHDYSSSIRRFLTEETGELKRHRGNCCVTSPSPYVSGMAAPRATAASYTHTHMLQMSKWR